MVSTQHGVIARWQLLALRFSLDAIKHRIAAGRLHPIWPGAYAVGRPDVALEGRWMAAVLCASPRAARGMTSSMSRGRVGGADAMPEQALLDLETHAALSDSTGAALWGLRQSSEAATIQLTVRVGDARGRPGISARRRVLEADEITTHRRIPVTTVARTILDLATTLPEPELERAVNEADRLDLIDPERLRAGIERYRGWRGVARLRRVLDRHTFVLSDSELEQRFLPIARSAGLPLPRTGQQLNGFKVDFHWPELGLVVETDGLRYHRTPAAQARDRLRDQAHTAAGLTALRFTHAQVSRDAGYVEGVLRRVAARLMQLPSTRGKAP